MCGIVGAISRSPVNQLLYDALLLLQHRGQDAAGIVTMQGTKCFMHKARGMVRDVFRTRNMRALPGNVGLGQVRYPTAGNAWSEEEAQPFYVNAPFGIVLVHNGNLTNTASLKSELFRIDRRHINTESDTEVLINILAHEIEVAVRDLPLTPRGGVCRGGRGAQAAEGLVCGDRADRRPWAAGLSRPLRHPPAGLWRTADRGGRRVHGGQRVGGHRRHRPPRACATWRRARRSSSMSKAGCTRGNAPSTRRSTPACSSSSTWRGPIRCWTASRSTRRGSTWARRWRSGSSPPCRRTRSTSSSRSPNRAGRRRCSWRRSWASPTAKAS